MLSTPPSGTNCNLTVLTTETAIKHWPLIGPEIVRAVQCGDLDGEAIKSGVADGSIMVVQVTEAERLVMLLTLEIITTMIGGQWLRMMNIITCTGENIDGVYYHALEFIERLAEGQECDGMMLKGRPGWAKGLKPAGYRVAYQVMTRVF